MKRNILIGILLAAMAVGVSCASVRAKRDVTGARSAGKAESAAILAKTDEFVARGDFKSALEFSREAAEKNPEDAALREGYVATIENIKKAADTAYEKADFTLSGQTYYLLLKDVPPANSFSVSLSFTKKGLTERLDQCRAALYQEALAQYRSGNLENAISLWKSILTFDPGNTSIKKSIDTATTQLKNLRQSK